MMLREEDNSLLLKTWSAVQKHSDLLENTIASVETTVWVKNGLNFLPAELERQGLVPGIVRQGKPVPGGSKISYGFRRDEIVYSIRGTGPMRNELVYLKEDGWHLRVSFVGGKATAIVLLAEGTQPSRSLMLGRLRTETRMEERYSFSGSRLMKVERNGVQIVRSNEVQIDDWFDLTYDADDRIAQIVHRSANILAAEKVYPAA